MNSLSLLLKFSLFILAIQAKHGADDDDDDGKLSTSSLAPSSTELFTSTSTVLLTSTLSSNPEPVASSSSSEPTISSPTLLGSLQFSPPANITTCEGPVIFTWEYDGSTSVPLTIIVTNERTVSSGTQGEGSSLIPLVERTLSTVDARVCIVSWPLADVPPGTYTLFATDTGRNNIISAWSSSSFVNNGSDTSCLNLSQNENQIDSDSPASPPPDETATDSNSTSDDAADLSSPSQFRGTRTTMSIGAIIETIAGILVGVGGLLFVFSLPRLRRRILRSKSPQRPGGPYILF